MQDSYECSCTEDVLVDTNLELIFQHPSIGASHLPREYTIGNKSIRTHTHPGPCLSRVRCGGGRVPSRSRISSVGESTSSVRSVCLEYLDAARAQHDAQVAAQEAFVRARDRSNAAVTMFPLSSSSPSPRRSAAGIDTQPRISTASRERAEGRRNHCRQQSVRFIAGSSQIIQSEQGYSSRTELKSNTPGSNLLRSQVGRATIGNAINAAGSTENPISAAGDEPLGKPPTIPPTGAASSYLDAWIAEEYRSTAEDGIASNPSSYRRVRKSRSMFMPADSGLRGLRGRHRHHQAFSVETPTVTILPSSNGQSPEGKSEPISCSSIASPKVHELPETPSYSGGFHLQPA